MKTIFMFSPPAFLILLCSCQKSQQKDVHGSYQSVSESEWEITLSLHEQNQAELTVDRWEPGRYNEKVTEKRSGHWSQTGDEIILLYGDKCDTLRYFENLSLGTIGKAGGAPGILLEKPTTDSLLQEVPLWKLPHRF